MDKKFDKLYDEICKEFYGESPYNSQSLSPEWYDNDIGNNKVTQREILKLKFIEQVKTAGIDFYLYRDCINEKYGELQDYFVDVNKNYTVSSFIYNLLKDNGIQFKHAWNSIHNRGMARFFVFEYYLKKYDYILSDSAHSPKGKVYWKRIINSAIAEEYKVEVIKTDINKVVEVLKNDKDAEKYYNIPESSRYIFKISKGS